MPKKLTEEEKEARRKAKEEKTKAIITKPRSQDRRSRAKLAKLAEELRQKDNALFRKSQVIKV